MSEKTLADGISADANEVTPQAWANADTPAAASNPLRFLEWYLDGRSIAGSNPAGANVDIVSTEYTGRGVVIGLVDEGFDITNPDLAGRFDLGLSYDPRDAANNMSIAPDSVAAAHGTWVAGVVGATANNGYGAVGVAPGATLAGFYARFGSGGSLRAEMADLLAHQVNVDVSNNSWGYGTAFSDNFQSANWAPIRDALHLGVTEGRDGLGTVYVFAAGNDRQYVAGSSTLDGDNTNHHNLTNSRFDITVAASTQDGHITSFSTPGASILVTAPGDSILSMNPDNGDGDRTNDFMFLSGTSFAAPIVSGVAAMMLEANPDLGYRDVQEILALSAHQIDPASSSWSVNGAANWNGGGHMVSHDFGFGLVDAHAAIRLAETWSGVRDAANEASLEVAGGTDPHAPPGFAAGYSATVASDFQNFSIEWVEVDLSLSSTKLGDLRIHLISPDGTDSILLDHPAGGTNDANSLSFTFSTNHAWGESPAGTWRLSVEDSDPAGAGSVASWALRFYGDYQTADSTYYYTNDFATLGGDRSTLTDASGNDTINASAVTGALSLDLTPGSASTVGGRSVVIGSATIIENAYGGDGNDTIVGNVADNHLFGMRGNDALYGGDGNDQLHGGAGNDTLNGGAGSDQFWFDRPGEGADLLADFTAGEDKIVLDHAGFGVTAGSLGAAGVAFATGALTGAAPGVLYNAQTGDILWDADGAGGAAAVAIARVTVDRSPASHAVLDAGSHPAGWSPVGASDFTGDGTADLAWYNADTGSVESWKLEHGQWAASLAAGSHPGGWQPAGSGDFNGDGTSDLAWYNPATGQTDLWKLKDGQWAGSLDAGAHPMGWQPAGTGDFNGDGTSDIAWYNAATGNIDIWALADGHWSASFNVGSHPPGWHPAGVGDFNGDGTSDIAWFNPATGNVDVWMLANGGWSASVNLGAHPGDWQVAGIGDFNGDGTSDILWEAPGNDAAEIWEINEGHWAASVDLGSHSTGWRVAGVGDFDHNGASDVMWRDNATGAMTNWSFAAHHQLTANDFLFA